MKELECGLLLLEPASNTAHLDAPSIEVCGSKWVLVAYDKISDAPPFTCISYLWGQERTDSPFGNDQLISARTIPVIEATTNAARSPSGWAKVAFNQDQKKNAMAKGDALTATQALWIDALCLPTKIAARTSSLRRMGEIYSAAWQVVVVLSASSSTVLHQIRENGRLDLDGLLALERDEWISRAWTYQEVVNSRTVYFIAQDDESTLVSGVDFLDAVLAATDDIRATHGIDSLIWAEQHPRLDALECLIADYKVAQFADRSAYQVMSAMHHRSAEIAEDHFYAMVGAISATQEDLQVGSDCSASEYFMRACEAKGDYSFIYSVAPRSSIPGRRWRPVEGKYQPVLPELLIFGNGQSASVASTHIRLVRMCRLFPGALGPDGVQALRSRLAMIHRHGHRAASYPSTNDLAMAILELLRARGFSGSGRYLELECGLFFPQAEPIRGDDIFVATSTNPHWQGGGPGLLLRSNVSGVNEFCDVGAFIGRLPAISEDICIG